MTKRKRPKTLKRTIRGAKSVDAAMSVVSAPERIGEPTRPSASPTRSRRDRCGGLATNATPTCTTKSTDSPTRIPIATDSTIPIGAPPIGAEQALRALKGPA